MPITEDRLRVIAAEAASALFPRERIGDIVASIGETFGGEEAYFFELHLDQDHDRDGAARKRIALRQAIRDRLLADGDEAYPYVRVLNRRAEVA